MTGLDAFLLVPHRGPLGLSAKEWTHNLLYKFIFGGLVLYKLEKLTNRHDCPSSSAADFGLGHLSQLSCASL